MKKRIIAIDSRTHLMSALSEAAELEHTLMCQYLFALFSLKRSQSENLTPVQWEAVERWRRSLLEVCIEEMGHLAMVWNLSTAVGGTIHVHRPHFPVRSGLFPQDFVLRLTPFSVATIEHFVFLERPDSSTIDDNPAFEPATEVVRDVIRGRILAEVGNYETVAQLYLAIEVGITKLTKELGEESLFCGDPLLQLGAGDVKLAGLAVIKDLSQACRSIELIIEQGEGARNPSNSHFKKFSQMRDELRELSTQDPKFEPARRVAPNPVSRRPPNKDDERNWISTEPAGSINDVGNAIYTLMLQTLMQVYSMQHRQPLVRKVLIDGAFSCMHCLSALTAILTRYPLTNDNCELHAGLTFDPCRHLVPIEVSIEAPLLRENLQELISRLDTLPGGDEVNQLRSNLTSFDSALANLRKKAELRC